MSPRVAARHSARSRSLVAGVILTAVLLGFLPLGRLSVEPSPVLVPRLSLEFSTPGLTASAVETLLTRPLESLLAGAPALAGMETVTTSGSLRIDLRPSRRRDFEALEREVQSRLERARIAWPASMDAPAVTRADALAEAAQFSVTSRKHDPLALRDWVEAEFARRLRELPGVEEVDIKGGAVREILVLPDQRRLAGLGLSFDDLLQAIRRHPRMFGGMQPPSLKKTSRHESRPSGNVTAMSALPVSLADGESLHLGEVASLAHAQNPEPVENDAEQIQVTVIQQPSANLADVARQVGVHVDWMRANRLIPDGIELAALAGPVESARQALKKLTRALIAGLALVLLFSFLLHGARRTLILGVILALALQAVLAAMVLAGIEVDSVTFGGLALGVGLFAGAALLLFARAAQPGGAAAARATVLALGGLMVAALASVVLAGGELSLRYREWAAAMGGAWLLSALLAWWLVPTFDAPPGKTMTASCGKAVRRAIGRARRSYGRLLEKALRRARLTLIFFAALAAGFIAAWLAHDFAAPAGRFPSQEIVLRLQGPDDADTAAVADDVVRKLSAAPELRRIRHTARERREESSLSLRQDRARDLGVDIAAAGRALAIASTGITVGNFRDAEHRYNVRMRLPAEEADAAASGRILLLGELERRPAVFLRDVAVVERAIVPAEIRRLNGKPVVDIVALPAPEAARDKLLERLGELLDEIHLPPGYRLSFSPEIATQAMGLKALGLAALLVFLAQALLSQSLRLALPVALVAGSAPMATGAIMILSGVPFTPVAWLGLIMLLGVVAGHSATLSMSAGTRPEPVLSRRLQRAARRQFWPLLTLALAGVVGMASLTWIDGDAFNEHMIVALIAGLLLSLPVNLFATPLLYLLSRKEQISRP